MARGRADNNRKSGEEFLIHNKSKKGVIETESGLQFMIVEQMEGQTPGILDSVRIHQRALLLDGKILEDTYRQNRPDDVQIKELIEGLQEGLQMMSVGSRYKFWIPADLAWGKKGTGNKIPPNAVLSFDIRLLEIIKPLNKELNGISPVVLTHLQLQIMV